jgi:hypothetical protein
MFSEGMAEYAIWRVDVILNPKLENMYEETKKTFQRMGRSTQQVVLFHGTNPNNVEAYQPTPFALFSSNR